jgi:hypothetical protein
MQWPQPRAAAAWATGATGRTDAGTRNPVPVTMAVVRSPGALVVAPALEAAVDLGSSVGKINFK